MKHFSVCCLMAGALLIGGAREVRANPDDTKDAELKRKSEEVDQLRKELVQRETELKRLKQENERLRKQKTPAPVAASAAPAAAKPVAPIATLPALADGAVVDASEMAGHFAAEPAAAAQRYVGKRIKVQGEVVRFGRGLVTRDYSIVLAGHDRATSVVCNFKYADSYAGVYPKGHGGELVARTSGGSEIPLARAGQTLIAVGKCKGFKDGEVLLTGCEMVR